MTWTILPRIDIAPGLVACRAGAGPDLVLLHGVGLRAEAWSGMLPLLTPHFRVSAIDLPGHGGSAPVTAPDLGEYTNRIAAALQAMPGPVLLAGHSLGALIALDLAQRLPGRVRAFAALNAVFRRDASATAAVRVRSAALAASKRPDPSPTLARWFGNAPEGKAAAARDACRDWLLSCDPHGYGDAYRVFADSDGPEDAALKSLPQRALFLTGADDPNSTPAMARAMANLTPHGSAATIPGAAHMAPMTHGRAVAGHLIDFFDRNGGST